MPAQTGGTGGRPPRKRRKARRATRTPTELGQTTPTTRKGQRRKAAALQAPTPKATRKATKRYQRTLRGEKRERQKRSAERQLRQLLRGRETATEQAKERAERKTRKLIERGELETEDDRSLAERLVAGGVVGLFDEDVSAAGRRFLYGSEDPSAAQLAVSALPGAGKLAGRVAGKVAGRAGGRAAPAAAKKAPVKKKAAKAKPTKATKGQKARLKKTRRRVQERAAKKTARRTARKTKLPRKTKEGLRRVPKGRRAKPAGTLAVNPAVIDVVEKGLPGVVGVAAAGQAVGAFEDPVGTAKRTGEAAASFITAPVAAALNVGATGKRAAENVAAEIQGKKPPHTTKEVLEPAQTFGEEFWKSNVELAEDIGSGDIRRVAEATKEKYGLTPAIMAGLVSKPITGRPIKGGVRKARRVGEKVRAKAGEREGMRARGHGRRRPETEEPQHLFAASERRAQRKRQAERAAVAEAQEQALKGEGRRAIRKQVQKIKGRRGVRPRKGERPPEDFMQLAAEMAIPLENTPAARSWLVEIRDTFPARSPNRLMAYEMLSRWSELVSDKRFRKAVQAQRRVRGLIEEERYRFRPEKQAEDVRSRYQPIAQVVGELSPEELVPREIRGITQARAVTRDVYDPDANRFIPSLEREIANERKQFKAMGEEINRLRRERDVAEARAKGTPKLARAKRRVFVGQETGPSTKTRQRPPRQDRAQAEARVQSLNGRILERQAERQELGARLKQKIQATQSRLTKEEIAQLREEAPHLPRDPRGWRALQRQKRTEKATARRLEQNLPEFQQNVVRAMRKRGLTDDPMWMRHVPLDDADTGAVGVARSYTGARIAPKEKFREGTLLEQGNVDYRHTTFLAESLDRQVEAMFNRELVNGLMRERIRIQDPKGNYRSVGTGPEFRAAERANQFSARHNALIPTQEFNRALREATVQELEAVPRGMEELTSLLRNSLDEEVQLRALRDDSGKKYALLPRETLVEALAQLEKGGRAPRFLRWTSRLSTRALLGTSPAWFLAQIPATGLMAAASIGPFALVHEAYRWSKLPPDKRRRFASQVEAATAGLIQDSQLSIRPGAVRDMADTYWVWDRTRLGQTLKSVATLDPLIAGNRWFESNMRGIVGSAQMRREMGNFLTSLGKVYRSQHADLDRIKNLPYEQQIDYYSRHPKHMERLADYVRDTMGSWQALTRYERMLGPLVAFYPFVRFSLRTVFRTYPSRHPVKAAILWNLATANAEQVRELIGSDASLTAFASVPLYTGKEGAPSKLFSVARFTPALNALVETGLDPATSDLGAFLKTLNPLLSIPLLSGLSRDPTTGRPLTDDQRKQLGEGWEGIVNRMGMAGAQLLALPAAARAADYLVRGEPRGKSSVPVLGGRTDSDISRLIQKIRGEAQPLRSFVFPFIPQDTYREREIARVIELLRITQNKPTGAEIDAAKDDPKLQRALRQREVAGDEAQDQLSALMVKWGITSKPRQKRESEAFGKAYGRIKYGRRRSSSDGLSGGGLSGGGLSGGGL